MEWFFKYILVCVIFFLPPTVLLLLRQRSTCFHGRFPPGPPGWPILGNLLDPGKMPHRALTELRGKYGQVIWLRLGVINTMVILSAKASTELFKNHDLSFVERTLNLNMCVHDFHKSSLALAPYGSYWRVLRRVVTVDMLVSKRINEEALIRQKCIDKMLLWIEEESGKMRQGQGVHVTRFVFLMTFNLLENLMLSKDLFDPDSKDGLEFFKAMSGLLVSAGNSNLADFFPWLRWLDPQGVIRKMERDFGKATKIASRFVKERINESRLEGEKRKDFLSVLLEFEGNRKDEPAKFSERDMIFFIVELFIAGSETTSSTIEWALTELVCKPDSMNKAKAELAQVVGHNRKVEESDIENLPYLQAVIKETLRLHPPIPFLVPRKAVQDTNFMGYFIPKNTQVLVNAWAIGRDPDVWVDPSFFKPERFLDSNKVDYKGQHYELIPFGAGRRMCAGATLAHRVLHLALGSLLHHFDWQLDRSVTPETMDMKDRLGITTRKLEPLLAVPSKSNIIAQSIYA